MSEALTEENQNYSFGEAKEDALHFVLSLNEEERKEKRIDPEIVEELYGNLHSWHCGTVALYIKEREGGISEFMHSVPIGVRFIAEGPWGLGFNTDFSQDSKVMIFVQESCLVGISDLLLYFIEKKDIKKPKLYNLEASLAQFNRLYQIESLKSEKKKFLVHFVLEMENIEDSYAFGLDMLDYLVQTSNEDRIFKKTLYLHKEDNLSLADQFKRNFFYY